MASESAAPLVLAGLEKSRSWQEELYREVHQHPELSHHENRTAGLVADRLRGAGYEGHERVGGTGVVGVLRNGDGPVVLLRADMDALPVREATGLPYASEVTSTDAEGSEVPVMHACGHDVHVACLAGAAQLLAAGREHCAGTVVALVQPAGGPPCGRTCKRPRRPATGREEWSRAASPICCRPRRWRWPST